MTKGLHKPTSEGKVKEKSKRGVGKQKEKGQTCNDENQQEK
jgi:hypothetical protein